MSELDDHAASALAHHETSNNPIVERFRLTKRHEVRYVEDRLSAILREISRYRSYSAAWEVFDRFGKVSADDEGIFRDFEHFLRLAEAYYKQYRASDEMVAALPLYYGSMWLARAIIALGGHPKCTTCGHLKMYQGSVGT